MRTVEVDARKSRQKRIMKEAREKQYRIIKRLTGLYPNQYELQKRRSIFGWKTLGRDIDCERLRARLQDLKNREKSFIVIEEFDE